MRRLGLCRNRAAGRVICEIRDAAATMLRDKGYLAAVQVPTQRIENGVVKLEMLYARVTTIRARGQTGGAEAKLAGYLSKLTQDEIFDRNRAERYLLLARDIPGYNVQLTLKPAGTGPGELIGEVSVIRSHIPRRGGAELRPRDRAWGGHCAARLRATGSASRPSFGLSRRLKEQQSSRRAQLPPGSEA